MDSNFIDKKDFEARFLRAVYRRIIEIKTCPIDSIDKIKFRITSTLDLAEELHILSEEHCSYLTGEMYLVIEKYSPETV